MRIEIETCRKCGELDYEMWDGNGTWAELYCNNCGNSENLQATDLLSSEEFNSGKYNLDDDARYPDDLVERAQQELIKEWNIRASTEREKELVEALELIITQVDLLEDIWDIRDTAEAALTSKTKE